MLYAEGAIFLTNKKAFWLSFALSAVVIIPAYLALLAYQLVTPSVAADTPQTDIPVVFPTVQDDKTVLVMTGEDTAQTAQTYVLVRIDGLHRRIAAASFPADTVVLVDGAPVALSKAVASAGPTQGIRALEETLGIDIDNYLFASPQTLWTMAETLGTARMRLGAYLPTETLAELSLEVDGVRDLYLSPRLFAETLNSAALEEQTMCALRAHGYAAFLAAGRGQLEAFVQEVRANSISLATDLTATQLYEYERLAGFLADGDDIPPEACALETRRAADGTYELTEQAAIDAGRLFG